MSIQHDINTIHDFIGNAEMPSEMQNDTIRALQRLEEQLGIVQGRWQPAEIVSLGDGSHSLTWIPKLRHVVLHENGNDIGYFLPEGWAICQLVEGEWLEQPTEPGLWKFDGCIDYADDEEPNPTDHHQALYDVFLVGKRLFARNFIGDVRLTKLLIGKWQRLNIAWPKESESPSA